MFQREPEAPVFEREPEAPVFEHVPEAVIEREPERVFEPEPEAVFERPPEAPPTFEREPERVLAPEPEAVFERPPEASSTFERDPEPAFEPAVGVPSRSEESTIPPIEELEPEAIPVREPEMPLMSAPADPGPEAPDPVAGAEKEGSPPGTERAAVVESFVDVETGGETEEVALSRSEAASVPVPVDMVEKIAQRVVAQVSEKVVREIAWDVVPELAEALIKQEIERLKAELQDL